MPKDEYDDEDDRAEEGYGAEFDDPDEDEEDDDDFSEDEDDE